MSEIAPPAWVRTPEGRLEPFNADRIARSLFAAASTLGQADAFLCRELTDGVVHFLALECQATPDVAEIAEVVTRTVRELGHPALARAYEARQPPRPEGTAQYSADVRAAQEQGLIHLFQPHPDDQLAAMVAAPQRLRVSAALARHLAVEGVEEAGIEPPLLSVGVPVRIHLNTPSLAETSSPIGPLFADEPVITVVERRSRALAWVQAVPQGVEWHVGEDDVEASGLLEMLAALALHSEREVAFGFDRPRRAIALGQGLSRAHRAVLTRVGVNLRTLAEQPGMLADAERYLQRLGSLLRLALSAAVQRRQFLRARDLPILREGFLLDRAIVVIEALHLDEVVRRFTGWSLANGGVSLGLGTRIVRRLLEVLRSEGRHLQFEGVLEGLTPVAPTASLRAQSLAAGALHALAEGGTLRLHLPASLEPGHLADELRRIWRDTAVGRIELVRE
jgi:hypothetical protein